MKERKLQYTSVLPRCSNRMYTLQQKRYFIVIDFSCKIFSGKRIKIIVFKIAKMFNDFYLYSC